MYSRNRLEALSDGIFAIAMTLLVLELKVPGEVAHGHLWEALRQDGEGWLAFLITFGMASRYWMLQHNVFLLTERFSQHAVVLTFVFLGLISVLPFSSSLVGRHGSEPLAFCLYCANQSALGVVLIVKLEYLRVRNKLPRSPEMRYLRARLYSLSAVMAVTGSTAWFLPVRFLFIFPVAAMLLGRVFLPKKRAATAVAG